MNYYGVPLMSGSRSRLR